MPSGKVPVYCHMSGKELGECGGGGWTLVMKTDGNKVSNNNRLFAVCRNMDINIILIRRFERMAKMYFVPPRVLTRYQSDIIFSCQNDWKVLTKTMKLSNECSQNSFVKANVRQIGRNGNGVTCCNFPTRLLFIYLFFYSVNVSLQVQTVEKQERLQPYRRKDFVWQSWDKATNLLEHILLQDLSWYEDRTSDKIHCHHRARQLPVLTNCWW